MSGSGITRWNAGEVINTITATVEANMEAAAKVVETDARHRMLSIKEPEFGRGYRRVLALYRLKSVVKRDKKDIVALIGIPRGEKAVATVIGSKSVAVQPRRIPGLDPHC